MNKNILIGLLFAISLSCSLWSMWEGETKSLLELIEKEDFETIKQREPSKSEIELIRQPTGTTAFHRAISKGLETIVKQFLAVKDIDVNLKDRSGWPLIQLAMNSGHKGIVRMLINAGADIIIRI